MNQVVTPYSSHVMSAPHAAEVAEVTYRQLDHWARQRWINATTIEQAGERRVRRYTTDDVVRLAALRHLAISRLDIATFGPQIGAIDIPAGSVLVASDDGIEVIPATRLHARITRPGRWTIFDPQPVRQRCADDAHAATRAGSSRAVDRRSA